MDWKDMDWLDFITWLSEEHRDIAKPTLNKIVEKTIHWKNERLKRNDYVKQSQETVKHG